MLYFLARTAEDDLLRIVGLGALAFDTAVICAYATIFSFEYGNQTRWATIFAVAEAAPRLACVAASRSAAARRLLRLRRIVAGEGVRSAGFIWDRVTFPTASFC